MRDLSPLETTLASELARRTATHAEDWYFVMKARLGLQVVLEVVAAQRGVGTVITQPFTCITAVNPILHARHTPVYADTSPDTLSIDPTNIPTASSVRAIIVQHSFGIRANIEACRAIADQHGSLLIEDSAHKLGLLTTDGTTPLADISVHSFGVEKMLPTKFGAALWINPHLKDTQLRMALVTTLRDLPPPSHLVRLRTRTYSATNRILNHLPIASSNMRHLLTQLHMFDNPIAPIERRGMNAGQPARPSTWILQSALHALQMYDSILQQRTTIGSFYYEQLQKHPSLHIPNAVQPTDALTRFPLVCSSAEQARTVYTRLTEQHVSIGKWYRPTLFPGPIDYATYRYDPALCPTAEYLSARIINLPTTVPIERAKEIIDELNR